MRAVALVCPILIGILANAARAADAPVSTGAAALRLGAEFRAEVISDDNGLARTAGHDAGRTTNFNVGAANIKLDGSLNERTSFHIRANFLGQDPETNVPVGPLDYGYLTDAVTQLINVDVGKMRILQGGWWHATADYRTHVEGVLAQNFAYPDYATALAIRLRVAGEVTLQVINDVYEPSPAAHTWNRSRHGTWVIGWHGEFGPLTPLLDFGSFDGNKSRWADAGIKSTINGLTSTVDFYSKQIIYQYQEPYNAALKRTPSDTATAVSMALSYDLEKLLMPWFYVSNYSNKQATDGELGLADHTINTTTVDPGTGKTRFNFDDNGLVVGFGVDVLSFGNGLTPFLACTQTSGKFAADPAKPSPAAQTRRDTQLKLGILGTL